MKAYFNRKVTDEEKLGIPVYNRSFLYGDGLFETMTGFEGKVKYLDYHLQRLTEGLKAFSIEPSDELHLDKMIDLVKKLFEINQIKEYGQIKIVCWRTSGGTYGPTGSGCEILVTVKNIEKPVSKVRCNTSFSKKVKNQYSLFSKFKTTNALKYVLAGIEKKERNLDDIIILDNNENVSECLISNIFWIKDGQWHTPSLSTGCIEGTSRKVVVNEALKRGIKITEIEAGIDHLLMAESVFSTNSSGIQHILKIDDTQFSKNSLIEEIYQPSKLPQGL